MTSVEVWAAREMIRSLPLETDGRRMAEYALGEMAIALEVQELNAATTKAAVEKLEAEAAELAAYGGIAGAEAGWNALRQHNPKVDRSSGVQGPEGEVNSFKDLSHKLKLGYAAFAFGVLNPGAKLGSPVPEETYQFKVGDKVRITGQLTSNAAGLVDFKPGQIVEVTGGLTPNGDLETTGKVDGLDNAVKQWIDPASLTLVTEPRTWDKIADIPIGITVTDEDGDTVEHNGGGWRWTDSDGYDGPGTDCEGPFTEVIA